MPYNIAKNYGNLYEGQIQPDLTFNNPSSIKNAKITKQELLDSRFKTNKSKIRIMMKRALNKDEKVVGHKG